MRSVIRVPPLPSPPPPVFFCFLRAYPVSALEEIMTSHQLLRLRQVEEKTGLKRSQIYLYMKDG
ncbi:AlpA family phage regulatory protein, partial [Acinetobacter baumannii]